ncbi:spermidine synthase [Verrucomicrobiaceae bacterium N1E253]|uniref:Spermidine synthase n=1 Tax=Oceaniferula marina TaxID=2748318 RepID=A0A851GJS9_9BACT|nr:fused MFS/spermidine synthase [Oceaniferula marina]NWK57272.1 spermidine synthase [Oceaniferula marina]
MISPSRRLITVALFLFFSGFCSLAYQVVWLREFRLVFGGSTLAASAVLAVFMGALGAGSWFLGRKADQTKTPGRFYARLEFLIGLSVLMSPVLLGLGQKLYYMTGGLQSLGTWALVLQMLISIWVMGLPCFLMGGTLPAAIRLVQTDEDEVRQSSAALYGLNIAGAVCGAYVTNFYLLEAWGNTQALLLAAGVNLLLGGVAYWLVALGEGKRKQATAGEEKGSGAETRNAWGLYSLAGLSGFLFFVFEILWFRSSIPLLGGSVYNFGLILVVVLLGMSLGGVVYSQMLNYVRPSYGLLALVSVCFALAMALPYIWGDGFARFCNVLQNGYMGYPFGDRLWVWFVIAGLLVFPASMVAGIQFPLILSLVGRGRQGVGRQLGNVYAFNTAGAVLGSILGGFVLVPGLGISVSWFWAVILALAVALLVVLGSYRMREWKTASLAAVLAGMTVLGLIQGSGLSVYWLQNPIGFGRSAIHPNESLVEIEHEKREMKRDTIYQFDGREMSGSLAVGMDMALLSNGKSDGTALGDAGTQIMLPMLGALLHPGEPKQACVIGVGTGTSVGWLAEVESIESVDVFELEPHLLECARYYASVNHDMVNHPKVNVVIGDARESLMTSKGKRYDLIASEPSNPQRVGVANLYTQDYYRSVSDKLQDDGLFMQWLQAYEIEVESVELILVTLRSVFPHVCAYQTLGGDVVVVCSKQKRKWSLTKMRQKFAQYPFKLGVDYAWGVRSIEGVLAHAIAGSKYVDELASRNDAINTDDQNLLEFRVARTGGSSVLEHPIHEILNEAMKRGMVLDDYDGQLNEERYAYAMATVAMTMERNTGIWKGVDWFDSETAIERHQLLKQLGNRLKQDQGYSFDPVNSVEEIIWARTLVQAKHERSLEYCERFKESMPLDYHALRLVYFWGTSNTSAEDREIKALINSLNHHIWCLRGHVELCLKQLIQRLENPEQMKGQEQALLEKMEKPFNTYLAETYRMRLRWTLAKRLEAEDLLPVILDYEPHFPFSDEAMLRKRVEVYRELNHENLPAAERDLELYKLWQ